MKKIAILILITLSSFLSKADDANYFYITINGSTIYDSRAASHQNIDTIIFDLKDIKPTDTIKFFYRTFYSCSDRDWGIIVMNEKNKN